jgi:hypothetical protein
MPSFLIGLSGVPAMAEFTPLPTTASREREHARSPPYRESMSRVNDPAPTAVSRESRQKAQNALLLAEINASRPPVRAVGKDSEPAA